MRETGDNVNHQSKYTFNSEEAAVSLVDRSGVPDDILLGGHAIASHWVVDWLTQGLDKDAVKNVMDYVTMHLKMQ